MEASLHSLITSLQSKLTAIDNRQQALNEERRALLQQVESLRTDLKDAAKRIEKLELDISFLRISHKLADSPDSIIEARRHISALIRRLDTSIALLKEDPAT